MRHGFLLIDKPCGPSSHDVVNTVRRRLSERAVGHLGTLDPLAEGLLVLAVGAKALKVIELFRDLHKTYEAQCTFGIVSSTYDRGGVLEHVQMKPGRVPPDLPLLRRTIDARFRGMIEQRPPAWSAVHVGGERAYERAKRGEAVTMEQRTVSIDRCDILSFSYPVLRLRIACGSGTYIRSLAHDLGQALRVGAYLSALRRTIVGEWSVEHAVPPENASWTDVIPLKDILAGRPRHECTDEEHRRITHGLAIHAPLAGETVAWHQGLPVALLVPSEKQTGHARPRKVF